MNKKILKLDADCVNCGQPAVAGSTMCVDCLVACNVRVYNENTSLKTQMELNEGLTIDLLEEKESELICLRAQLKLTKRVMRHVFGEYQKLQNLQGVDKEKRVAELELQVEELEDSVRELRNS